MFFFSSRRRHTRCSRDWSSDVCSSDLDTPRGWAARPPTRHWRSASSLPETQSRRRGVARDRKSTRLNSSHGYISYAVFCLKKKKVNGIGWQESETAHKSALPSVQPLSP